jgi:hypothetical protein
VPRVFLKDFTFFTYTPNSISNTNIKPFEALADVFLRNLAAINEFLIYVEAHKSVAFKKVKTE